MGHLVLMLDHKERENNMTLPLSTLCWKVMKGKKNYWEFCYAE